MEMLFQAKQRRRATEEEYAFSILRMSAARYDTRVQFCYFDPKSDPHNAARNDARDEYSAVNEPLPSLNISSRR
jgi:hypothetical protein